MATKRNSKRAGKKAPKKATPTVKQFLEKLGGAPETRGKRTPAKGLLGEIRREDLVKAGRIQDGSAEGPAPGSPTGALLGDPDLELEVELSVEAAEGPGGHDGRQAARVPWRETVKVSGVLAGPPRDGQAGNLSSSGIFIETTQVLEEGDPVLLAFPGDTGAPLNVSGRVRWVTPFGGLSDAQPGMGIEFVGLDSRKRRRLEKLLDGLPEAKHQAGSPPVEPASRQREGER